MSEPFVLGVNYWPRRKAMYWWSNFDAGEVGEEFAIIQSLGLRLVRIFLLWDDFQPIPTDVDAQALQNLVKVADIAADLGIKLDITFFTGHMSGPNWSPRWLLHGERPEEVNQLVSAGKIVESGYLNPYTERLALEAERVQIKQVVGALKDHPGVGIWNLGNEPDLFAWPPDDLTGQSWVGEMTGLIHSLDSQHPVTCGLHNASLVINNGLRVDQVFAETDFAVMHGYPMYMPMLAQGPLDPEFVPFLSALTAALSGKKVLMEEFGGCTAQPGQDSYYWEWTGYGKPERQFMASEEALAEYLEKVLPKLVEVGATGAVVWCYSDYIPELWDRPPCSESRHERFFGLVRPDGSLKLHTQVLRRFAESQPVVQPATKMVNLPYPPAEYYRNPWDEINRLYAEWLNK